MLSLGPLTDKFSESAQQVLFRALEESRRREHHCLSVEHIFYALGEVESPLLTKVLQSNGADPQMVAPLLEQELSKSYPYATPRKMYITDPTRELFTCALKRARAHGRQAIDSFDLFVALFRRSQRHARQYSAAAWRRPCQICQVETRRHLKERSGLAQNVRRISVCRSLRNAHRSKTPDKLKFVGHFTSSLLIPERDHRIHFHRPPRWQVASQKRNHHEHD